jgi:cytochrome c oxidase cbb3-type subunit I/II
VYDHPFQWGSKRTGPDLGREGTGNLKKSDGWHFRHLREPSSMSEGSIMPPYAFMIEQELDISTTPAKIRAMQTLGVPYPKGYDTQANTDLSAQADLIKASLKTEGIDVPANKEIIAVIAYLQRLGTDIGKSKTNSQK